MSYKSMLGAVNYELARLDLEAVALPAHGKRFASISSAPFLVHGVKPYQAMMFLAQVPTNADYVAKRNALTKLLSMGW